MDQPRLDLSATGLHTLGRWSAERAVASAQITAVDDRGVHLSYLELELRAGRLAQKFLNHGYGVGDRIATISGNSSDQIVLFFACAKAGLVLTPLSWRLSPSELAQQLHQAEPQLLVIEEEYQALSYAALKLLAERPATVASGSAGLELELPSRIAKTPAVFRAVQDNDPLLLIFTSGTEGKAKGALISHSNCYWNNLSLSKTVKLTESDVVLSVLPQFHVGGWNIQPLLAWWLGATVVLERVFDPGRILQLITERKVTSIMAVPTQYLMLTEHPEFANTDFSSLKHTIVGGAAMPEELLRIWHGKGVNLTQGYGLTEASPNVLCLPYSEAAERIGWAGKPYEHVEVKLVDPQTREAVIGAGVGELAVHGPSVFLGYYRDDEATGQVLNQGWLYTGDLFERDEQGYYRVVDRLKEIFISGGENVSPAEIEKALLLHPEVNLAAVTGVADSKWGEVGAAWVVRKTGSKLSETELFDHLRNYLASYKIPKHLFFVDRLPLTGLQKIARRKLRDKFEASLSQSESKQAEANPLSADSISKVVAND